MARRSPAKMAYTLNGVQRLFPDPLVVNRAPLTSDFSHPLGQVWIYPTTGQAWILSSTAGGLATWSLSSPGASDVDTINSLSPVAGDILIDGGTNLTDTNAGNTVTLNLNNAITLATSVTSPIYASVAAMAINPVGALTVTGGGAIDLNAAAGSNVTIQLGDAAGANILEIEDSASAAIATIDSVGTLTVANMDGIIGATTPAAITGTTLTGNTSITAPLFTAAAADALVQAGGVNDVVVRLGDNAGATYFRVQDSDSADVYTVDSNGGLAALAGLTVTGALVQTAGQVDIGMDNLGSAINICGGNVIKALAIGGGAAAHTIAIGSAAAGAITVDSVAGISLDAATASNFTVTGAADLTIASTAGGVDTTSGEAAADAISLDATDAAGGVTIAAGTGGLNFGNQADCTTIGVGDFAPTAARTISIGGGTVITAATTDIVDVGPDGATTNANSIKTVNINGGGVAIGEVLTNIATGAITSGTHTVSIQSGNAAAGTVATNISTGTGTKSVNVGNADTNTTINLDGDVVINTNVNSALSACVGTSTGTVTLGNIANSGAMSLESSTTIDLDAAGAVSINSTGGVLSIGNDAVAQNMNIGTGAAARVITVGNVSGASSVVVDVGTGAASFGASATAHTTTIGSTNTTSATVIQSGTGDLTFTGTIKEATTEFVTRSGDYITFQASPMSESSANTGVDPTGANTDLNLLHFQEGMTMEQYIIGTQTIIVPRMDATGLLASLDLTAADGWELNFGATRANSRHSYTIGTSAAFFMELRFTLADVSGCEPFYFGFRRTQANQVAFANYTDFVGYGVNNLVAGGDCIIGTQLNTGGVNSTDTNDAFGDGTTHTLQVLVSAAGTVTFTFDAGPPTQTQAFSFDNGDVVHPWIHNLMGAGAPGNIHLQWLKVGYQA